MMAVNTIHKLFWKNVCSDSLIKVKLLEFDRINAYEGKNTIKNDGLPECIICHYWYFLKIIFRFQPNECNDCHDLTRSSHRRCSVKKGVLGNLGKFTGKHLRQSLFFKKQREVTKNDA